MAFFLLELFICKPGIADSFTHQRSLLDPPSMEFRPNFSALQACAEAENEAHDVNMRSKHAQKPKKRPML
jgi:hypothetical protein